MGPHVRLRARISVLVAAGTVVVAVGVALLLGNTLTLRRSADATIRSNDYLVAVVDVERLVVDAETGLRGYVITRRQLFLAPLQAAESRLPAANAALLSSAARAHAFVLQARGLAEASRSYLLGYIPTSVLRAAGDPRGARSFAATLAGKQQVDGIRGRTAALERLVSARQTARQRAAHRSADHAVSEAIAVLVLLTGLTLLLGALLGRLVVGRELAHERSEITARTLQRSLLPPAMPVIPGCELAVRFSPAGAGELVGGDFYDVFAVAPDRWAIALGDVCGKGAQAAAVTAMARWTLRSLSAAPLNPADSLLFLNDAMLRQELSGRFLTIAYLLLTVAGGQAQVSIACAGHPAPIMVPASGEPTTVEARGDLLGVWSDITLHTSELQLTPGDSLVAYTDGVTDQGPGPILAHPGEMLRHPPPGTSAEQLAARLESYAHQHRRPQRDDIAILALRFKGDQSTAPSDPWEPDPVQARRLAAW